MSLMRRLRLLGSGSLWLIRPGGLRGRVERLTSLERQLATLDARLRYVQEEMVRRLGALDSDLQWVRGCLATSGRPYAAADVRNFERRVSSQNGEDGIIEEIFRRIGTTNRWFVEFGVESGVQCNCARLAVEEGWHGLFMEADPNFFAQLQQRYAERPGVRCARALVSSDTIEALLAQHQVPAELDLLSIDIDGNDYWVWEAIRGWRPRVVVIEYNASHDPSVRWVMLEDPSYRWNGTTYYGASLASLAALGRQKGYTLVGTNSTGVNAFFVRDDLVTPDRFLDPSVHYHYSPATHGPYPGGHPWGDGPAAIEVVGRTNEHSKPG
jgi:hypothetical protein